MNRRGTDAVDADATAELIRTRLQTLSPERLEVVDDSAAHAGHAGAAGGGGHYTVTVSSAAFIGKSPVERHRAVYALVSDLIPGTIHALAIRAQVPESAGRAEVE